MGIRRQLRTLALVAAATCLANLAAGADFSFNGYFGEDDDQAVFSIQVVTAGTVTIQTWSYAGGTDAAGQVIPRGGFDPYVSLFDASGVLIGENDDGAGKALDPHTGAALDSLLSEFLVPGFYTVVLTESPNGPNGPTLANGFHDDGNPTFTSVYGCGFTTFCDVTGDHRTPNWELDIDNVAIALPEIPDSFQVSYSANLSQGGSFINLTNTGYVGATDPAGDICANIYVFDQSQELLACCACPLTPEHASSLAVATDLGTNLLTGKKPNALTVALLASASPTGACDATSVPTTSITSGLRAWNTTVHISPSSTYQSTETPFAQGGLSIAEYEKMTTYCSFIKANGSGAGLCNVCTEGYQGSAKQ